MARFLAERGERVTVVERGGIGAGASGRNGGYLLRRPDGWQESLRRETLGIYEELAEASPVPFDLAPRPLVLVALDEHEAGHARAHAAATGGEALDPRSDPWLADDLTAAFRVDGSAWVDAMSATAAMAEVARARGARFRPGCEAKRILVASGRVTGVATDEGVTSCGRVVIASGPRVRFLLRTVGLDVPVSAVRGWLLETEVVASPPPYAVEQAIWPSQEEMGRLAAPPTLAEVAAGPVGGPSLVSLLLGPKPSGAVLVGTSLNTSVAEEPEGPETVQLVAARAARVLPGLAAARVVATWSGRRSISPDGLPVVGPVPGVEGLEVAGAFGSAGMVTAPAACRALVDGRPDPAFAPARLLPA